MLPDAAPRFFAALLVIEVPGFWSQRIHLDDCQRVLEALDSTRFQNNAVSLEYRWQRANGQYRWFLDQMVVVRAVDDNRFTFRSPSNPVSWHR